MFFCLLFIFLLTFFIFLNYMSEYSARNRSTHATRLYISYKLIFL